MLKHLEAPCVRPQNGASSQIPKEGSAGAFSVKEAGKSFFVMKIRNAEFLGFAGGGVVVKVRHLLLRCDGRECWMSTREPVVRTDLCGCPPRVVFAEGGVAPGFGATRLQRTVTLLMNTSGSVFPSQLGPVPPDCKMQHK